MSFWLLLIPLLSLAPACTDFENYCDIKDPDCSPGLWLSLTSGAGSSGCISVLMGGQMYGCSLNASISSVTTIAGDGTPASVDGTGILAQLDGPGGVTTDGTNLYVMELAGERIRQINLTTLLVTTLAGSTTGSNDGVGAAAQFDSPPGITTDGTSLFVGDEDNHLIRRVDIATANVTTFAGGTPGFADGTGAGAQFLRPRGVTTDGTSVYVGDAFNHRIRKIDIATAVVTTIAGSTQGFSDGTGAGAQFDNPNYLTTDGVNLYVSDTANHRIRKIDLATNAVTTLAGSTPGALDGNGTSAQFNNPLGITTDGFSLFVVDRSNHRIRKIDLATNEVTTLAGSSAGFTDASGTSAQFSGPRGITTDGVHLFVGDESNNRIRMIE